MSRRHGDRLGFFGSAILRSDKWCQGDCCLDTSERSRSQSLSRVQPRHHEASEIKWLCSAHYKQFMHPKQTDHLGKLITTLSQSLTSFRRKKGKEDDNGPCLPGQGFACVCDIVMPNPASRFDHCGKCKKLSIWIQFWVSNQHIISPFGLPPYKSQKVKICSLHLPITS